MSFQDDKKKKKIGRSPGIFKVPDTGIQNTHYLKVLKILILLLGFVVFAWIYLNPPKNPCTFTLSVLSPIAQSRTLSVCLCGAQLPIEVKSQHPKI